MDLDIKVNVIPPEVALYVIEYVDLDGFSDFKEICVAEDDLLDYVVENELNMITPNPQEDFAPYPINPKRALEQFEDEIIEHYLTNKILNK